VHKEITEFIYNKNEQQTWR